MPLYEYRCGDCGNKFEELVSSGREDFFPICPQCNSKNTQKQFSTFAAATGISSGVSCPQKGSCPGSGGFT